MIFSYRRNCVIAPTVILVATSVIVVASVFFAQAFADDVVVLMSKQKKTPVQNTALLLANHPQLHKTAYSTAITVDPREAKLLPHRATYAISLNKSFDPEINDITGTMSIEISDTGEQWTHEKKAMILVTYQDGTVEQIIIRSASWESKNEGSKKEGDGGPRYHFYTKVNRGVDPYEYEDYDELQDQGMIIQGEALMATTQGEGIATYQVPYGSMLRLPVGTLFPLGHTEKLMQEAVHGKHICSYLIFDGENESIFFDNANEQNAIVRVNTVITPMAKSNIKFKDPVPFPTDHIWFMHMAVYNINPNEDNPDPDYEVSQTMLPHGIIANMTYHFGDFNAQLKLTELEFFSD